MSQSTGNQGTVLIVEDDRNTAMLVAAYLEREGFSTVVVHDGGRAIEIAGACAPVFVILDGNGKLLHIQDSGFLEHCQVKGYDTTKVLTFLKMWNVKAMDPATYSVN